MQNTKKKKELIGRNSRNMGASPLRGSQKLTKDDLDLKILESRLIMAAGEAIIYGNSLQDTLK